jgi:DNA-binding transcriptional ArsR family regulator
VEAFDVLGDPVRRRILELLLDGERAAGDIVDRIGEEFGIGQPAVSMQLKVLRDSGFASVRPDGSRRLYAASSAPFAEVDAWLGQFRHVWEQRLDALGTEIARGRRRSGES